MVKILLDEQCYGLAPFLSKKGYATVEAERSQDDEIIVKYAKLKKLVLVTKDRKMRKICDRERVPVVYLADLEDEANSIHEFITKMSAFKEFFG